MKYRTYVAIKSMIITIFILVFLVAMLVVYNEGKKKIDGEGVFVYLTKNALYLKKGRREIKVEPDKKRVEKALNFSYEKPFILPFPFNFLVFSDSISKNFS